MLGLVFMFSMQGDQTLLETVHADVVFLGHMTPPFHKSDIKYEFNQNSANKQQSLI